MIRPWLVAALFLLAPLPASAQTDDLDGVLERPTSQARLPRLVTEASGLSFAGPGRLWTHDDERGAIYRIDPSSGRVLEERVLGPRTVRGDFEGLAFDGEHVHLVTSGGTLVSFRPGPEAVVEDYSVRETAAGSVCEVEGVEFDPVRTTLVLACKVVLQEDLGDRMVLLEVDLPPGPTEGLGRPLPVRLALTVSDEDLAAAGLPRSPRLSGIAYDPTLDAWWLVAARDRRVFVVDREGAVLGGGRLRSRHHPQAEGIAIDPATGTLLLVDEGGNGRARLTIYSLEAGGSDR